MQVIAGTEQGDATEVVQASGSAGDLGHRLHAVGYCCRPVGSVGAESLHLCEDSCRVRRPSQGGFVQDSHGQDIEPADLAVLSPVQWFLDILELIIGPDHHHFAQVAQESVVDQSADVIGAEKGERAGDDLGDQFRVRLGGRQHQPGFCDGAGHAGFCHHVLAGVECRAGDLAVHVGPGSDHHGIDFVVGDQVLPRVVDSRDFEFCCRTF